MTADTLGYLHPLWLAISLTVVSVGGFAFLAFSVWRVFVEERRSTDDRFRDILSEEGLPRLPLRRWRRPR